MRGEAHLDSSRPSSAQNPPPRCPKDPHPSPATPGHQAGALPSPGGYVEFVSSFPQAVEGHRGVCGGRTQGRPPSTTSCPSSSWRARTLCGKSPCTYMVKLTKPWSWLRDQAFLKGPFLGEALGGAVTRRLHMFHLCGVHWRRSDLCPGWQQDPRGLLLC